MSDSKLSLPKPELTDHPVDIGMRSEAAIVSRLVRSGYSVLLPFGVNQRYDLVIDIEGELVKAQCKTGRLCNGVVRFSTRSVMTTKTRNLARGYTGEADIFLVFCPQNGCVYVVPVGHAPATGMFLRVEGCRNRQRNGVNWASDYELPA